MRRTTILSAATWLVFFAAAPQLEAELPCDEKVSPSIHIDPGHPWRPHSGSIALESP